MRSTTCLALTRREACKWGGSPSFSAHFSRIFFTSAGKTQGSRCNVMMIHPSLIQFEPGFPLLQIITMRLPVTSSLRCLLPSFQRLLLFFICFPPFFIRVNSQSDCRQLFLNYLKTRFIGQRLSKKSSMKGNKISESSICIGQSATEISFSK